ncbi:hypothetical protein [Flexivirga oryzae]|uniref:N-acetyltransferase domain-containing protein n=1 Tax=Flexivirga oryzae TaxID=1794944 RepID=A0A839N9F5_9MICO|nr:hypothetical protein [Flexivirga oryzae]MBB2891272.1 hypothetical protein [Flexivirga oryzae]
MDAAEIMRIAATSYWVPPDSEHVVRDGFTVVRYDNGFQYDTGVYEIDSARPAADLFAEVTSLARSWGRPATYWNGLNEHIRPASLIDVLLAHGGEEVERLAILALDLNDRTDLAVPADVTVEVPLDRAGCEASARVAAEGFERDVTPVTDAEIAAHRRTVETGSGISFVAHVDGRPAATGGTTYVADGRAAKLWGGASTIRDRGRGAYRAVLEARLRAAQERGCEVAIVGGRVGTSAPILRRAGFRSYGEEFMLRVPVGPAYPADDRHLG